MKKLEFALVVVTLTLLVIWMFFAPGAGNIFIVATMTLACFYFYLGFAIFNGISLKTISKKETYTSLPKSNLLVAIIVGVSVSGAILSVVFSFMNDAKDLASIFALSSIIMLSFINIVSLRQIRKGNPNLMYKRIVQRAVPYMAIALLTYIVFQQH